MKISFDFDSCLSRGDVQELAERLLQEGNDEIWVVTSRTDKPVKWIVNSQLVLRNNEDLFEVTDRLGIKRNNIIFTCHRNKSEFLTNFDIHLDDDDIEIEFILEETNCKPIWVEYSVLYNWEKEFNKVYNSLK
jgi:hypothetical protein